MKAAHKLEGHFAEQSGIPWQAKVFAFILGGLILAVCSGCSCARAIEPEEDNGCPYDWRTHENMDRCICDFRGLP